MKNKYKIILFSLAILISFISLPLLIGISNQTTAKTVHNEVNPFDFDNFIWNIPQNYDVTNSKLVLQNTTYNAYEDFNNLTEWSFWNSYNDSNDFNSFIYNWTFDYENFTDTVDNMNDVLNSGWNESDALNDIVLSTSNYYTSPNCINFHNDAGTTAYMAFTKEDFGALSRVFTYSYQIKISDVDNDLESFYAQVQDNAGQSGAYLLFSKGYVKYYDGANWQNLIAYGSYYNNVTISIDWSASTFNATVNSTTVNNIPFYQAPTSIYKIRFAVRGWAGEGEIYLDNVHIYTGKSLTFTDSLDNVGYMYSTNGLPDGILNISVSSIGNALQFFNESEAISSYIDGIGDYSFTVYESDYLYIWVNDTATFNFSITGVFNLTYYAYSQFSFNLDVDLDNGFYFKIFFNEFDTNMVIDFGLFYIHIDDSIYLNSTEIYDDLTDFYSLEIFYSLESPSLIFNLYDINNLQIGTNSINLELNILDINSCIFYNDLTVFKECEIDYINTNFKNYGGLNWDLYAYLCNYPLVNPFYFKYGTYGGLSYAIWNGYQRNLKSISFSIEFNNAYHDVCEGYFDLYYSLSGSFHRYLKIHFFSFGGTNTLYIYTYNDTNIVGSYSTTSLNQNEIFGISFWVEDGKLNLIVYRYIQGDNYFVPLYSQLQYTTPKTYLSKIVIAGGSDHKDYYYNVTDFQSISSTSQTVQQPDFKTEADITIFNFWWTIPQTIFSAIGNFFIGIGSTIVNFFGTTFFEGLTYVAGIIASAVVTAVSFIVDVLINGLNAIGTFFGIGEIGTVLQSIITSIAGFFEFVIANGTNLVMGIVDFLGALMASSSDLLTILWIIPIIIALDFIFGLLETVKDREIEPLRDVVFRYFNILKTVFSMFMSVFHAIYNFFSTIIGLVKPT